MSPALADATRWRGSTAEFDHAVGDIFGYHALQLGCPSSTPCGQPHAAQVVALGSPRRRQAAARPDLITEFDALPFEETASTWWCCRTRWSSPRSAPTLREVERVLVPEGAS